MPLSVPENLKDTAKSSDVIDNAFSYAKGETSQTIETDDGLIVLRVDEIIESHQKPIEAVKDQIKTLWAENERTAMAQETLNDIMHDLQEGADFTKTGQRYGLHVYKSQPVTRNESFADLSYDDMRELFSLNLDEPYQASVKDKYLVIAAVEDFENSVPLSEDELNMIRFKTRYAVVRDLQKAMLDSYAKDYKTKVKYKLMGIED